MAIELTDDGTMDTVLRCSECGEEMRFNYDGGMAPGDDDSQPMREQDALDAYDAWVEECIAEVESEHECASDDEPQEEDITTEDYQRFYYCGKCIVEVSEDEEWQPAVGAWCKAHGYFPNVWAISDHGNAHLISVTGDGRYLGGHSE